MSARRRGSGFALARWRIGLACCALFAISLYPATAFAHEVRPAYLELRQSDAESYEVLWKVPALGDNLRLGLQVELPPDAQGTGVPRMEFGNGASIQRWSIRRHGGLTGARIGIAGLAATSTDVLVRLERLDGTTQVLRLTPAAPSFVVEAAPGRLEVASTYLRLGIEHILSGFDHLLFVLALLILVKSPGRLLWTITAFTVAHSLTLALATFDLVRLPAPPVEATIALSIVFVASEIIHRQQGRSSLTQRWPWAVAFCFGLLHGLGFAGALAAIGLPQNAIPLALLFFNAGVELGQLLFIAGVLLALAGARFMLSAVGRRAIAPAWHAATERVAAYAIGSVAAFWLIDRSLGFFLA